MLDLSMLQTARNKVKTSNENYLNYFNQGVKFYEQFTQDQKENTLKNAATNFLEALDKNKNNMEPYLYLSMIYLMFGEDKKAKQFFEVASELGKDTEGFFEIQSNLSEVFNSL